MAYTYGIRPSSLDADQLEALEAYDKARNAAIMHKVRKAEKWKLSQASTARRLLLNGTCVVFKEPSRGAQQVLNHLAAHAKPIKRKVYKETRK